MCSKINLLILFLLILSCKTKKEVVLEKVSSTSLCSDKDLQLLAENYRRVFLKDSELSLADYSEQISDDIDSLISSGKVILRREFLDEVVKSKLEQQMNQYKYHDSSFAIFLNEAKNNVEQHINIKRDKIPIISSKPAFAPNAEIIKPPLPNCNRRIIFINEGVKINFYRIPRALLSIISKDVLRKPNFSYDVQNNYFEYYLREIITETGALWKNEWDTNLLLDNEIIWHYVNSVYHFLIAHEYIHDLNNHDGFLQAYSAEGAENQNLAGVNKISYSWAQELEADYYASKILLEIPSHKKIRITYPHLFIWGGEYFCTFLDYHSFLQKYNAIGEEYETVIAKTKNMINSDTISSKLKKDKREELLQVFKEYTKTNLSYFEQELPKIGYKNLDSLAKIIHEKLPRNPNTKDFENILLNLKLIFDDEKKSHPHTFLRRVFCRVSILRNSKFNPMVNGNQNHGDLYWENCSKANVILNKILNDFPVDEAFIDKFLKK